MPTSAAQVTTDQPGRYLKQLCRHFGHKHEARFDDAHGEILLPSGSCRLGATPGRLTLEARAASADELAHLEDVIGRHLERFAHRDALTVTWSRRQP
jgi:hypothetical protein